MIRIRAATPADLEKMLSIYELSVRNSPASFEIDPPSLNSFEQRFKDISSKYPWIVCEIHGEVVGYSYASPHRERAAYQWSVESSVYLSSSNSKKGIGRALYSHLFQSLKEQGICNVFAGITIPNEASIRLHESLNFNYIGTYRNVGFKLNKWWDVGWWQLELQLPNQPKVLTY